MRMTAVIVMLAAPAFAEELGKASSDEISKGKRLFDGLCAGCHGTEGAGGGVGPPLARPKLARARDDEALMQVIRRGIPGSDMPMARQWDPGEVFQIAAYVKKLGSIPEEKLLGSAAAGRDVYFGKGGCKACHTIQGVGGRLGPELGSIGAQRSASHMRRSIVEPEAEFADRFLWVRLEAGGRTYEGVRLNDDTFSIQIMDAGERIHSFWKRELTAVTEMKSKSPMPSYKGALSAGELEDLVAFLASMRGEP
ncbi:MAG: c-type cytochrome [Acidimicrobiia bacterium]|nr:c-type cytochrome [Acidimicrobiia bacterium]